jgi:glycosyltransferase involved in cell wall biosynthesis
MARGKGDLLVFQTAYPLRFMKERGLEVYLDTKDPGGFFDRVITVNTVASLQDDNYLYSGPLYRRSLISKRNTVIECGHALKIFRGKFRKIGFILSQLYFFFRFFIRFEWRDVKIIYADDPEYNGILGLLFSKILRKPLVVGIWGNPARIRATTQKPLMPGLFQSIKAEEVVERYVLLHADALQVQNNENSLYPISIGIDKNKISILPLAVGISECHFLGVSERASIDFENFQKFKQNIVCVSRLEQIKHIDHVIKAFSLLGSNKSNTTLHLIGAGDEGDRLKEMTKDLRIEEQVVFYGAKSQEWISSVLPKMDLAVAPLTGRALLEIALSGLPVVAYDVDWHNEIVIQDETGILVRYRDIDQLSKAIEYFFTLTESQRVLMGKNMRQKALSICDRNSLNEKQNSFYRKILD